MTNKRTTIKKAETKTKNINKWNSIKTLTLRDNNSKTYQITYQDTEKTENQLQISLIWIFKKKKSIKTITITKWIVRREEK